MPVAGLILALAKNVILPELMTWWQQRHQQGLPPPTKAEADAWVDARASRIIANGNAFLAATTPPDQV